MERLVDGAVDDLIEHHAGPLAQQIVRGGTGRNPGKANPEDRESESLATLQEILLGDDRDQLRVLSDDVSALRHQLDDKQALAAAIAPILGNAIRRQIRESREEIIDALYPIIGQLVVRAVTEAMRDLARSIDEKLQAATDFQRLTRWMRALATGVPAHELALRESMPVLVHEVYLIHRETGLLLWHTSRSHEPEADSDLIGSMLTAIREFAEQVLGGNENHLHELHFGNKELILEFGRYSYAGLVIDGVAPSQLRWKLHEQVYNFENRHQHELRQYSGDASTMSQSAHQIFAPFLSVTPK